MKFSERQKIYTQLEDQNGQDNQVIKAIEEMSELIKELTKLLGKDTYTNKKNICEELADAKICIEQIQRFLDIDDNIIDTIIEYKLKRLSMFYLRKHIKEDFVTELTEDITERFLNETSPDDVLYKD